MRNLEIFESPGLIVYPDRVKRNMAKVIEMVEGKDRPRELGAPEFAGYGKTFVSIKERKNAHSLKFQEEIWMAVHS